MSLTPSNMPELGTPAPAFRLPDTRGRMITLDDFAATPALLVIFLCNHCPYVKHLRSAIARFARDYRDRGLAVVGINANDPNSHPQDAPERMAAEVAAAGYIFPYLFDETQVVAKAFQAACTPDFFLYDEKRALYYRGQFDGSRPGNDVPVSGADLRAAVDALLAGDAPPGHQQPSVGCNIKWR